MLRVVTRDEDMLERRRIMQFVKPLTPSASSQGGKHAPEEESTLVTTHRLNQTVDGKEVVVRRFTAEYLELTRDFHHPDLIR